MSGKNKLSQKYRDTGTLRYFKVDVKVGLLLYVLD